MKFDGKRNIQQERNAAKVAAIVKEIQRLSRQLISLTSNRTDYWRNRARVQKQLRKEYYAKKGKEQQ